ncbi:MAG: ribbon-helix-helix domain-containing protein [bacterium]
MQKTLTIRLPDDIRNDLEDLSRSNHVPISELVRESIKKYVAIERFRKIRGKVLPFAETQGLLTDDDIFKTLS